MSAGEPDEKFDRWKVDLVCKFFKDTIEGGNNVEDVVEGGIKPRVVRKSAGKVIDIDHESDDECDKLSLDLSEIKEASDTVAMIIDLIICEVCEVASSNIIHSKGDQVLEDAQPDADNEEDMDKQVSTSVSKDYFSVTEAASGCEVEEVIVSKKIMNEKIGSVLIDASKVAFACQDVRLKTGFPAKVVLKHKNCLSIIIRNRDDEALMKQLGILTDILGSLGCGVGGRIKFYSQSKVINNQLRRDLVFESEREASKVQKFLQGRHSHSLESFLLTESELGYNIAPIMSEAEMMYIMAYNLEEDNIMKMFDGKVEQDDKGEISFKFSSLAGLNLFLTNFGEADKFALGLFRNSGLDPEPMVLKGVLRDKRGQAVLKLSIVHSVAPDKTSQHWKYGWNWPKLEEACNFEIGHNPTKSSKLLIFETKLSLFQFWGGPTAKVLSVAKILDFKLGKNKSLSGLMVVELSSKVLLGSEDVSGHAVKKQESNKQKINEPIIDEVEFDSFSKESKDKMITKKQKEVKNRTIAIKVVSRETSDDCKAMDTKKLMVESEQLKEELEAKSLRLEELETSLKNKSETIAALEERLVAEREAKAALEVQLSGQDVERQIQEEIDRRTLENQISNLANFEYRSDQYYNKKLHVVRNLSGAGRQFPNVCRSDPNPQIRWSSLLGLTFNREDESGSNYALCLRNFLRSISGSLHSVFMEADEIILKFKNSATLNKALSHHATQEGGNCQRLKDLKSRARVVPDILDGRYCVHIFYNNLNYSLQSKTQLLEEVSRAGGTRKCKEEGVNVSFLTLIAFVRALTNPRLGMYHNVNVSKSYFELIGGNGEDNYYKGQVCLTESNLLSMHFIGEQEAGFAECFSRFLKDQNIVRVDLGRNSRLLFTFYTLKALEDCLMHFCQFNCNTLAKLLRQPVRCKLIPSNRFYSLLCPTTAVKKDFLCYQDSCTLEEGPRRISSKSKLCMVQILRDVHWKYPEIHFSENNFLFKTRKAHPRPHPVEVVHVQDDFQHHPLEEGGGSPGDVREITSDYEESVFSEAPGFVDARH